MASLIAVERRSLWLAVWWWCLAVLLLDAGSTHHAAARRISHSRHQSAVFSKPAFDTAEGGDGGDDSDVDSSIDLAAPKTPANQTHVNIVTNNNQLNQLIHLDVDNPVDINTVKVTKADLDAVKEMRAKFAERLQQLRADRERKRQKLLAKTVHRLRLDEKRTEKEFEQGIQEQQRERKKEKQKVNMMKQLEQKELEKLKVEDEKRNEQDRKDWEAAQQARIEPMAAVNDTPEGPEQPQPDGGDTSGDGQPYPERDDSARLPADD